MKRPNIAFVIAPSSVDERFLEIVVQNASHILASVSGRSFIITGTYSGATPENVRILSMNPRARTDAEVEGKLTLFRLINHLLVDMKMAWSLLRMSRLIDIVMYHIGAKAYPLSIMTAKLLNKKVVVFNFNPMRRVVRLTYGGSLPTRLSQIQDKVWAILERFALSVANQVWVESESVIRFSELTQYMDKTRICGTPYVNTNLFKRVKRVKDRKNCAGFFSRLEERKGVMNFTAAIPLILAQQADIEFYILGKGILFQKIEYYLKSMGCYDKVSLPGWIEVSQSVQYLNELKLLVLPSYSEGLPGIIKEAMACGTPVLATPVGGIPDLIKDGETGFILEDNSPESIARSVIRVLNHPNLDGIADNACRVAEQYSYEAVVENWKNTLAELVNGKASPEKRAK